MAFLSSKKSLENFAPTQPPHFSMVRHIPVFQVHLLQKQLELMVIQATRLNEVHCFRDCAHYVIHPQHLTTQSFLVDNAMIHN